MRVPGYIFRRAVAIKASTAAEASAIPPDRSIAVRLSAFYGVYFLFVGIMAPFWPVWLASRGLGPAEVGLVLAGGQWLRVATGPLIATLTDRWGRRRRMMLVLTLAALALFGVISLAHGFWPLLLLSSAAMSAASAMLPIGESVALAHAYRARLDYGRIRLWGSLTFIAGSGVAGGAVRLAGIDAVLGSMLAALAATVVVVLLLPKPPPRPAQGGRHGIAAIAANRPLLMFGLTAVLLQESHAMFYGFASLHWRAQGVDDLAIGLLWAAGVVAETVLFAFSGRVLDRIGVVGLLRLAALAGVVRWTGFAFDPGLVPAFVLMALHAGTFGATHLAAMHFITRLAPPDGAATAQALFAAAGGLAMGAAASASGFLYEAVGSMAYLAMAALAAAAGTLTWWLREPMIAR
jgi:PPP family 3-phenylpropionic acid transporter